MNEAESISVASIARAERERGKREGAVQELKELIDWVESNYVPESNNVSRIRSELIKRLKELEASKP